MVQRDYVELGPGLGREHFDLEPSAETSLVGEKRRHLGHRVSGDHLDRRPSLRVTSTSLMIAPHVPTKMRFGGGVGHTDPSR